MNSRIHEEINIGGIPIGHKHKPFIIAEIAQAHDGSLGTAHAYIDVAADAGVDAIKFQTHIAAEESTLDEEFRIKFSYQDQTRFDYWKRMEFTEIQWKELSDHAKKRNLFFLSSPFSVKAVDILEKLKVPAWKVGSGEILSEEILDRMCRSGAPILLSTGMSKWAEIEECVQLIKKRKAPYALMQCTSMYPTSYENIGLNVIKEMRERFECPVGLSDHSGSIYPGLAAMALGATLIEVHIIYDRKCFGPDTVASITPKELRLLVEARDAFFKMFSSPVEKDQMAEKLSQTKSLFTKSFAPALAIKAGTVLTQEHLKLKKPGTGIPKQEMSKIIGKKLRKDVTPNRLLQWEDME